MAAHFGRCVAYYRVSTDKQGVGVPLDRVERARLGGSTTLRGVARARTARGVPTARGTPWSPVAMAHVIKRAEAQP
jgi:hypothetical protein